MNGHCTQTESLNIYADYLVKKIYLLVFQINDPTHKTIQSSVEPSQ